MTQISEERLEELLIKTKGYLGMFQYNLEDASFRVAYNKHFSLLRYLEYEVDTEQISKNEYVLYLVNETSSSRPEIVYTGPDKNLNKKWYNI